MIVRPVKARSLRANRRLDCKYFLSPGNQAAERLAVAQATGTELRPIVDIGRVWMPGRLRKTYAATGEPGIAYLRAYDIFDYVPQAADMLSAGRSENLPELRTEAGTILQTRSGRNLGPAVAVDPHLASFALSDDLIRIEIEDEADRFYTLAFLCTPTGQALLRRDKTGSVIDHLSVGLVEQLLVPFLDIHTRNDAARHMREAVRLRSDGRATLAAVVSALAASLPAVQRSKLLPAGWALVASGLGSRVDAAYHDPHIAELRAALVDSGGQSLRDVADVSKPSGRYKAFYVAPDHGRPLLSGRQVLQYQPINLHHISPRSLDPSRYQLEHPWLAMQADGRSEERLGVPVMIEPGRAGWLASGHVARIIPREGVHPGWLYAAVATYHVQSQIKALACGSVVDALYEPDLEHVVLPPPGVVNGDEVILAWNKFTQATHAECNAVRLIEDGLAALTGGAELSA